MADPAFVPGFDLLMDLRATDDHPSAVDLRERARRSGGLVGRFSGRVAQVFVTNDAQYGMARMYSVFAQEFGITAEQFVSFEAADLWLKSFRIPPRQQSHPVPDSAQ